MAANKKGRPQGDHYNTGEIVVRLQRDKRRSWIYFFGALLAGGAIVGFLFFQGHRMSSSSSSSPPPPVAKVEPPAGPRTSVLTPLPPQPPPPVPITVQVQVQASKPGIFWLDSKLLGMKKQFDLTLSPGTYELKGKFGRKTMTERLAVDPNSPLTVRFDPKKKKALIKVAE